MFTSEELRAVLPALASEPIPPIKVAKFGASDFLSPASEETIIICRGIKSDFESALHFWVAAQRFEDWTEREEYFIEVLSEALCQPIDEVAFLEVLRRTESLKQPVTINPESQFRWGLQMFSEWFISSAIAEFEGEFISAHWETTS